MLQKKVCYIQLVAAVALFAVFLTGCFEQTYVPATIEITDPGNGMVYTPPEDYVKLTIPIHGVITKGEANILNFGVWVDDSFTSIPYDSATGEFEYLFDLDPDSIYSICTFEVVDTNTKGNMKSVSIALGESSTVGGSGVVDDALIYILAEDVVTPMVAPLADAVGAAAGDTINVAIAGVLPTGQVEIDSNTSSKYTQYHRYMVLDPDYDIGGPLQGLVNIGDIAMTIDEFLDGNEITAALAINPGAGVNHEDPTDETLSLYIQGYTEDYQRVCLNVKWWGCKTWGAWEYLTPVNFNFTATKTELEDILMSVELDASGGVISGVDFSGMTMTRTGDTLTHGSGSVPSGLLSNLTSHVIDPVFNSLGTITADSSTILDVDALDLAGIDFTAWSMNDPLISIVSGDPSSLSFDLGIAMNLTDWSTAINQGVDAFWATPGDTVPAPEFSVEGDTIIVAASDDFINQAALVLVQSGELSGVNLTSAAVAFLALDPLSTNGLAATASVATPPIYDFASGAVNLPDINIEIVNLQLQSGLFQQKMTVRASISVSAAIEVAISEDMAKIEGSTSLTPEDLEVLVTFCSGQSKLLPLKAENLIKTLGKQVLDMALAKAISINLPATEGTVGIVNTGFDNNYLTVRLNSGPSAP